MSAKCSGCNEIHVVFSARCYKIYITLRSSKCRSKWVQNVRKSLAPKHWRYVFPTSLYLFVVSYNSLIITPLSFANKTLWLIKAIFMTHYFHSYTSLFIFIVTQDCLCSWLHKTVSFHWLHKTVYFHWLHKTVYYHGYTRPFIFMATQDRLLSLALHKTVYFHWLHKTVYFHWLHKTVSFHWLHKCKMHVLESC